jgi:hypothetical protein
MDTIPSYPHGDVNPNHTGFRRRCGWCAVELRWWQLNLCRTCKQDVVRDLLWPRRRPGSHYYAKWDRAFEDDPDWTWL